MKLVLNAWLLALVEGLAETIALAEGARRRPGSSSSRSSTAARSAAPYAKLKGTLMIERSFAPSFSLALARQGRPAGRRGGRARGPASSRCSALIREQMGKAVEAGHGDEDMAATFTGRRDPRAHHRRLPERLHAPAARSPSPTATRSPARINALAALRRLRPRRRHARLAPARPRLVRRAGRARGRCTASQGTPGARAAPGARPRRRSTRSSTRARTRDTEGYSRLRGHRPRPSCCASAAIDAGHGRRAGHRLLRQEHRARRAARGLRGHGRHAPRCAASRSQPGDSERALAELRAAGGGVA